MFLSSLALTEGLRRLTRSCPSQAIRLAHTWQAQSWDTPGGYLGTGSYNSDGPESRFLLTGACGQVGSELIPFLRARVGAENVIASDVKINRQVQDSGPFVYLDVTDKDNVTRVAIEHGVTHVIHLATLLSAVGERNPQLALKINTSGIQNVLDVAAQHSLKVFSPSTIAVFGSSSPSVMTPNETVMIPRTMYGITKVHTELLGQYYKDRLGVDFRSLRYPGIVSPRGPPGGGTTDYAVDIFHHAVLKGAYTCFLDQDLELPMMYMPDCLEATWQLMTAPLPALSRTTYNVTAMSFTPDQLATTIRELLPDFHMRCTPDYRNEIAKAWPRSIDDSAARADWGWRPRFELRAMAIDMMREMAAQHGARALHQRLCTMEEAAAAAVLNAPPAAPVA